MYTKVLQFESRPGTLNSVRKGAHEKKETLSPKPEILNSKRYTETPNPEP